MSIEKTWKEMDKLATNSNGDAGSLLFESNHELSQSEARVDLQRVGGLLTRLQWWWWWWWCKDRWW